MVFGCRRRFRPPLGSRGCFGRFGHRCRLSFCFRPFAACACVMAPLGRRARIGDASAEGEPFLTKALSGVVTDALGRALFGASQQGRGNGKGGGRSKASGGAAGQPAASGGAAARPVGSGFVCGWDDCKAAIGGRITGAGKLECYACNRPKGQALAPPLVRMCERAFCGEAQRQIAEGEAAGRTQGQRRSGAWRPACRRAEGAGASSVPDLALRSLCDAHVMSNWQTSLPQKDFVFLSSQRGRSRVVALRSRFE